MTDKMCVYDAESIVVHLCCFLVSRSSGKERDTESGLDNFGARYFGSSMGRFMSPDYDTEPDIVPYAEFENPQTLNLHSYARNNPLLYNDPDGHDVNICDNSGNCHQVSNEQYQAAQQGNKQLECSHTGSGGDER